MKKNKEEYNESEDVEDMIIRVGMSTLSEMPEQFYVFSRKPFKKFDPKQKIIIKPLKEK